MGKKKRGEQRGHNRTADLVDYPLSSLPPHMTATTYELIPVEAMYKRFNLWQPIVWFSIEAPSAGLITEENVSRALWAICRKHPLLRARRDGAAETTLRVPPDFEGPFPLKFFGSSTRDAAWESAVNRALHVIWTSHGTWELEVHVDSDEARSWMAFQFLHSIVDGRSVCAVVLKDFSAALSGADIGPEMPIAKPFSQRLPHVTVVPSTKEDEEIAPQIAASLARNASLITPLLGWDRLDRNATASLVAACRAHGVTVNAAIAAAFGIASGSSEMSCFISVDLRQPGCPVELCFSVSSVSVSGISIGPPSPGRFWHVAQSFSAGLKAALSSGGHLRIDQSVFTRHFLLPLPPHRTAPPRSLDLVLSNIGVIDGVVNPGVGGWNVSEFVPIGGNNLVPGLVVMCATIHECLSITTIETDPPSGAPEFGRLFSTALSMLRAAN